MEQKYLIDTNVLIDFFNAKLPDNAKKLLLNIEPIISVITRIELFSSKNITDTELSQLKSFVSTANIINVINEEIVNKAIDIRLKTKTKTPDAIIAATAIIYRLIIVSRNVKDFNDINGLEIIDPYTL